MYLIKVKLKSAEPPKLNIQMQLLETLRQLPSAIYLFVQNTEISGQWRKNMYVSVCQQL